MADLIRHEDGVHLNLPKQAYHADYGIGGTDALKTLWSSPPDWWWKSPFNEIAPPKDTSDVETPAQRFGTALHVALLEGMDTFTAAYGIKPSKDDYPDALETNDELKEACRARGLALGGTKDVLIDRLLDAGAPVQILKVIQELWEQEGYIPLGREEYAKILLMHRLLMQPQQRADGSEVISPISKAFEGGLSEVTVFWTETAGDVAIPMRARFDKLKPKVTVDLKSFSNWSGRDFDKAMLREAAIRKYPMQVAHYEAGRVALRNLVDQGKVYGGSPEERALLERIAAVEKWQWHWIFYKTDGAPRAKSVPFDTSADNKVYIQAMLDRERALANFVEYATLYGMERMWFDPVHFWEPEQSDWPLHAMGADV